MLLIFLSSLAILRQVWYNKNMRIQQLHYIIKIVETGSMNEAAKQLFITQPSLSMQCEIWKMKWALRSLSAIPRESP